MKTKKNKKCGYYIGVLYDGEKENINNVIIISDGLITKLPYIPTRRDFDGMYDDKTTIALNNLLKVIDIADLNTLFSLKISIYKDIDIMNKKILKEFSFSILEPLYKDTLESGKEFKITEDHISKVYNEIYPSIVKKGGNEYLIEKFNEVLGKTIKYIHNMKLKDIVNPDIFIIIEYNYDDYIISNKFDINRHVKNSKRYRLESFVKYYVIS